MKREKANPLWIWYVVANYGRHSSRTSWDDGEINIDDTDLPIYCPPDPERYCIRRDNYQRLSEEAKFVIKLVIDGPQEVVNLLSSGKQGLVGSRRCRYRLAKYLRSQWDNNTVSKVIGELMAWARTLT